MPVFNGPPTGYVYAPYVPIQSITSTGVYRRIIRPVSARDFEFFFKLTVEWSKRFPVGTRLSFDQDKIFGGLHTTNKITIPNNPGHNPYYVTTNSLGKLSSPHWSVTSITSHSGKVIPTHQTQQSSPYWKSYSDDMTEKYGISDNTYQVDKHIPPTPERILTPVLIKSIAIPLDDFSRIGVQTNMSADENEFWNIEDFEEFGDFFESFHKKFEAATNRKKRK